MPKKAAKVKLVKTPSKVKKTSVLKASKTIKALLKSPFIPGSGSSALYSIARLKRTLYFGRSIFRENRKRTNSKIVRA